MTLPTPFKTTAYNAHQDQAVEAGSWWRLVDETNPIFEKVQTIPDHGLIFLVKDIHVIDGDIHSVTLAGHPLISQFDTQILIQDFLAAYKIEPEGAFLRKTEQNAVMTAMTDLQNDVVTAAQEPLALPMPEDTLTDKISALPAPLRGDKSAKAATAAQTALALAEARTKAITDITSKIEKQAHLLTAYQKEQVLAMQASVSKDVKAANETLEKLHTLTLFLGEHQTVTQLRDGKSAPENERLHFFQRLLFLDEEFAVHFLDEPFYWRDSLSIDTLFENHPGLIDRLMPQPRSVIIARVRRHMRALPQGADYATLFQHIEESQWDMALMILVRDGERVFMIEADQDTANAQRLFPSQKEIADLYKSGWQKDTVITPEDLAYTKSRSDHDQRGLFYKRFLVLFWGLHTRKNLFGSFMPADANWFDPDVQAKHFTFIHDEETGLDAPGPTLMDWIKEGLKSANEGDMVVVDTRHALDLDTCPSAFQDGHKTWIGENRVQCAPLEIEGADAYVRITLKKEWGNTKPKRHKLYLFHKGKPTRPEGTMTITYGTTDTVSAFIDSRRDRMHYATTMAALAMARTQLREWEQEEAGLEGTLEHIRLARAATNFKPLEGRTLTRVRNIITAYTKEKTDKGLMTPRGTEPTTPYTGPGHISTPWITSSSNAIRKGFPLPKGTKAHNIDWPETPDIKGLDAPGLPKALEQIIVSTNTGNALDDPQALNEACAALRKKTLSDSSRFVLRHDLSWAVGFVTTPSWERQHRESYLISVRVDPYARLSALGHKDDAIKWIEGVYGKPKSHIERLDTLPDLTLEARVIKSGTRLDTLPEGVFMDWKDTWSGSYRLDGEANERDALVNDRKHALSGIKSQYISVHHLHTDDWAPIREKIKTWTQGCQWFIRKDAIDRFPDLAFEDATLV